MTESQYGASVPRLTREQAAIIGLYTGLLCGPFGDMHAYAECLAGRPIQTIEFGLNESLVAELKKLAEADFIAMAATRPINPKTNEG